MIANSVRINAKTYGKLVEAAAKNGDADCAVRWLGVLDSKFGIDSVALNAVIHAHVVAERIEDAVKWLRTMSNKDLQADATSYNTVLAAFSKQGRADDAVGWLDQMISLKV